MVTFSIKTIKEYGIDSNKIPDVVRDDKLFRVDMFDDAL